MTTRRERSDAKLTALAAELAIGLHLRSSQGAPIKELADLTGLTPALCAALAATGKRLMDGR